jgi:hypothetical protein
MQLLAVFAKYPSFFSCQWLYDKVFHFSQSFAPDLIVLINRRTYHIDFYLLSKLFIVALKLQEIPSRS